MSDATTLPAKRDQAPITLRDRLIQMKPEFTKALPGHITADKFIRTAQTAIALTRNIEKANHHSLLAACTKAAADGLILDGREAALVIDRNGDAQYRPMMRGLLKLAYNSGQIRRLVVEVVRDADHFEYEPTRAGEPIVHRIDLRKPRGEPYALYAMAELTDGGIVHEIMTVEDVNRIRDRSDAWKAFKSGSIKNTPWSTDWSEMARKTVFRRLSKYLPSSTDRDDLHNAAERIDEDYIDINVDAVTETKPAKPTAKKRGAAALALRTTPPAGRDDEPVDDFNQDTGEINDHSDHPDDDI